MSRAMRQMPGQPGRASVASGEAVSDPVSDEACGPPREHPDTGSAMPKAGTGGLLEAALTRQNLLREWKRVKANKGAAGVDGLDIEQTAKLLQTRWPEIRQANWSWLASVTHSGQTYAMGWTPSGVPRPCNQRKESRGERIG